MSMVDRHLGTEYSVSVGGWYRYSVTRLKTQEGLIGFDLGR
jgi:hypothetical protein